MGCTNHQAQLKLQWPEKYASKRHLHGTCILFTMFNEVATRVTFFEFRNHLKSVRIINFIRKVLTEDSCWLFFEWIIVDT